MSLCFNGLALTLYEYSAGTMYGAKNTCVSSLECIILVLGKCSCSYRLNVGRKQSSLMRVLLILPLRPFIQLAKGTTTTKLCWALWQLLSCNRCFSTIGKAICSETKQLFLLLHKKLGIVCLAELNVVKLADLMNHFCHIGMEFLL